MQINNLIIICSVVIMVIEYINFIISVCFEITNVEWNDEQNAKCNSPPYLNV